MQFKGGEASNTFTCVQHGSMNAVARKIACKTMRSERCDLSARVRVLGPAPSAYLAQGPARSICLSKGRSTGRSTGRRTQIASRMVFHACVREFIFIDIYKQHTYEFCCRLCHFVSYKL